MNKEIGNGGENELGEKVYRKLLYFYQNKLPVHFSLIRGGWKNGEIVDLSEEKLTLVLKEFMEGNLPFLCEEIDLASIAEYRKRGEDGVKNGENERDDSQSSL